MIPSISTKANNTNNIMKISILLLVLYLSSIILSNNAAAGKSSDELDGKITSYYKGQPTQTMSAEDVRGTLESEAREAKTPLPKLISAFTVAKTNGDTSVLPFLSQIKAQHSKLTFRTLYPDTYKYVRGIDYHQKVCDIIDDLNTALAKKNR